MNNSKSAVHQNLYDISKTTLRDKFKALNADIKKEKWLKNQLRTQFKKSQGKIYSQNNPKKTGDRN